MKVFDDVVGHGRVIDLLRGETASPSHAYLFVGPAGVGKATVARRFAAGLLCGADSACSRRVIDGVHPDLIVVEPEGVTSLTVDQARAAVARAVLSPVEAGRKVFLFEDAGLMTEEAANTLLKTLEEPSETTIFILTAESEHELPATIVSRTRTVLFSRTPETELSSALARRGIQTEQAERAAAASGGRPGMALMLATEPEVASFRSAWLSVPQRLDSAPATAFRLATEMVSAVEPLLQGIVDRQDAEAGEAELDAAVARRMKDRHSRERKRASAALHVTGLEILASWYRDAAAAQHGAATRNRDVPGADLADVPARAAVAHARRVLATVESLEANQRPELAFAALFSDLATQS